MFSVNRRSHVIRYVLTLQIFGTSRSCAFGKTVKMSSINSTPQIELSYIKGTWRSYRVKSCAEVMCRDHVDYPEQSAFINGWSCNSVEVTCGVHCSRVKRGCQLVVRLKANKCYQELLCYSSSYIKFQNYQASLIGSILSISFAAMLAMIVLAFVWSIICIISPQNPNGLRRSSPP